VKLAHYKSKRDRRNFSRTVKYQCRKSLADLRPRIKGSFARDGEPGSVLPHQTKKAQQQQQQQQGQGQQRLQDQSQMQSQQQQPPLDGGSSIDAVCMPAAAAAGSVDEDDDEMVFAELAGILLADDF
jgi:transcription initiation factor TFIID subunit TAF12